MSVFRTHKLYVRTFQVRSRSFFSVTVSSTRTYITHIQTWICLCSLKHRNLRFLSVEYLQWGLYEYNDSSNKELSVLLDTNRS